MSKGNTFENQLLLLIFNNDAITLIGDAAGVLGSAADGSLYVGLHTADPGEGGDQTTSEATYTGYARIAVARTTGGWTVTANAVANAAAITFGKRTDVGSETITHFLVGTDSSGAGKLLYKGSLGTVFQGVGNGLAVGDGITIIDHTLAVDERVAFYPVGGVAVLPAGITEGTAYWVKTVAADVITISTTQGGGALDITADGAAFVFEATVLAVSQNIQPQFNAGDLDITED